MKNFLFLMILFATSVCCNGQSTTTGPDVYSQLWNLNNGYYGTVNANTLGNQLDSVYNATLNLVFSSWRTIGNSAYDSARVLINGVKQTGGLPGRGSIGYTCMALKASATSTVTPTVIITPQQSPNANANSWVSVPGATAYTISPTSRTTAAAGTINLTDIYQRYTRMQVVVTDSVSVQCFLTFKPKA